MIIKYNNKVVKSNYRWLNYTNIDPLNPLGLPPYTIRLKLIQAPSSSSYWDSMTLVEEGQGYVIYDFTRKAAGQTDWSNMGNYTGGSSNLREVLGANTTGVTIMTGMFASRTSLTSVALFDTSSVTNMRNMFTGCTSLINIPLFDTSSVTDMRSMFVNCSSLTTVPLFDTSSVTDMNGTFYNCTSLTSIPLFNTSSVATMGSGRQGGTTYRGTFEGCVNVQSGALALYQQASTQTTPPTYHVNTFYNCGSNTQTGAAELALIPEDWGGTYVAPSTITCPTCNGTGYDGYETCPTCDGSGNDPEDIGVWTECSTCNGTGEDPNGGSHEETCPNCNGSGEDPSGGWFGTCSECGGAGTYDYGEGEETCHLCGGSGEEWYSSCPSCGGVGTTWVTDSCPDCGGAGGTTTYDPCQTCNGTGLVQSECATCSGTGQIEA